MSSYVQDQLKATGIAQVIVVLKAPAGGAQGAGAARKGVTSSLLQMGAPSWGAVAAGLERYFISPGIRRPNRSRGGRCRRSRAAPGTCQERHSSAWRPARGEGPRPRSASIPIWVSRWGRWDKTGLKGLRADERVAEVAGAVADDLDSAGRSAR